MQWLAGFIDGDGSILTYKEYVSIEATTGLEDEGILCEIKKMFGGTIKSRSNAKALRWRSRKKEVVIKMIKYLNGNIRNTVRVEQLKKACKFLNIEYKECEEITEKNSYLTGLFDADGTITLSVNNIDKTLNNISGEYGKAQRLINSRGRNQCIIKYTNKNKKDVEMFEQALKIGKINYEETKNGGGAGKVDTKWNWTIKKEEIHKFMEYLKENPLRGKKKKKRFHQLPKYFKLKEMGAHLAEKESKQFKEWINFCNEWYNIN